MALIFPDVEAVTRRYLLDHLSDRWPGLVVSTEVPESIDWQVDKPYLIVVSVTGSGDRVGVVYERVLLGLECYAPIKSEASQLVAEVRAFLEEWPRRSGIVAGHTDNARPTKTNQDGVSYPSYWYSANILFKATDFNI